MLALVSAYLSDELSLRKFHEWFIPATWDLSGVHDAAAISLINEIQLLFLELSGGDISEAQFKDDLRALAPDAEPLMVSLEDNAFMRVPHHGRAIRFVAGRSENQLRNVVVEPEPV